MTHKPKMMESKTKICCRSLRVCQNKRTIARLTRFHQEPGCVDENDHTVVFVATEELSLAFSSPVRQPHTQVSTNC